MSHKLLCQNLRNSKSCLICITDPPSNDDDMDGESSAEDAEAASGLNQSDYEASVATLKSVSDSLDADCVLLRERVLSGGSNNDKEISPDARRTGQYLIRRRADCKVCLKKKIFGLLIFFSSNLDQYCPYMIYKFMYVVQVFVWVLV